MVGIRGAQVVGEKTERKIHRVHLAKKISETTETAHHALGADETQEVMIAPILRRDGGVAVETADTLRRVALGETNIVTKKEDILGKIIEDVEVEVLVAHVEDPPASIIANMNSRQFM